MIYVLRVHSKINFYINFFMRQSTVRFLPNKNNTDTESLRLVYNKFKIDNNYANKTRR